MTIGILREPTFEKRVVVTPEVILQLKKLNTNVLVERDAGSSAYISDKLFVDAGAEIADRSKVIAQSEVLLRINAFEESEIKGCKAGQVLLAMFNPYQNKPLVDKLVTQGVTAFSLEMVPRITRAQSMDVLSSMATVAGYRAVLDAALHLPRFFPMFMTAAGTIKPAKVLILGAGVAGLQAIATSRKLGAIVEVFDVRSAVKEEVQSLGGKFIEVEGARDDKSAGGYAIEQTDEFKQKQKELIHAHAVSSNVVITTAQIPGRRAPLLLTKETVQEMMPGSVIIDLAASSGGNCELTQDAKTISHNGITIIGKSNYPSDMSFDASKMFGNNVLNFLKLIITADGQLNLNFGDEIVRGTCIVHNGEIVNDKLK
jgi:H+-translocating NAD(P) transhydrogenase subunit alpha